MAAIIGGLVCNKTIQIGLKDWLGDEGSKEKQLHVNVDLEISLL